MEIIRADKFISSQLNITRSQAVKLIKSGAVLINGSAFSRPEIKIDPSADEVSVNGIKVCFKKNIYIMMNKPMGVVSASNDAREKTVIELVPPELSRRSLFPAGRLDKDTTGFVLITDDGAFAHNILAPGRHVPKTYIVTLAHPVSNAQMETVKNGMTAGSEEFLPAGIKSVNEEQAVYEVILYEGKYHQIKRMFAALDNEVTALHRIKIGSLELDKNLAPGCCREISNSEIKLITC